MQKLNTIFSFVLLSFCLLINVSYSATIEANVTYSSNTSAFSTNTSSDASELFGYTAKNIAGSVEDYIVNSDDTNLKIILKDLASKGYSKTLIYIELNGSLPTYCINIYPDEFEFDFTFYEKITTTNGYEYVGLYASPNSYYYKFKEDRNTYTELKITQTSTIDSYVYNLLSIPDETNANWGSYHFLEFNGMSVKQVTRSSGLATWDGETYYYKADTEPSVNYDLFNLISIIKNSTEIKNNIKPYLSTEYFIVPDGTVGDEEVYEIYFYHDMINLCQFEYVYNDSLYYDLDKAFLLDENIIINLIYWIGQNSYAEIVRDVQLFTLYYNPETGTGDIYLTSNMTLNELKSFNSETQPIIYTTKDIAYYSATWGETDTEWTATPDETKNVLKTEIVDSEGNVINPSVSDYEDFTVIIENVNFDEINKTFEENKGILNIENASWLFTANNKLIGYFVGFLSLLIVFLIISRVLGG